MKNSYRKFAEAGLKVNTENLFFGRMKTKYLGFWVSKNGVRTLLYKVNSIKEIDVSTKLHGIRQFLGLIYYYRYMWNKLAHTLYPLTKLCSTKFKFTWNDIYQKALVETKKIVGRDVII